MPDQQSEEWRKLTFSQRAGKVPLPEALYAGELTTEFRNLIWFTFETDIRRSVCVKKNIYGDSFEDFRDDQTHWQDCFSMYRLRMLSEPHDQVSQDSGTVKHFLRKVILEGEVHEVLTLVELCLRIENLPEELSMRIEECFQFTSYYIDCSSQPACILPATSEAMKEHVKSSLDNINNSELTGAKSHLGKSSQELNNRNYAGSVRESIHAVASAAQQIDPKASKDLGPALDSLERSGIIKHRALKEAFKKLYGYASDEQGIRKSLIKQETADVGFDEAIFMYGACVSFVDYLVSKQRQLKE